MVTFTNPFSVAVRGILTVAGSGLLKDKVLIKYVKSFSVQSQFTAVQCNLNPFCTDSASITRISIFSEIRGESACHSFI